MVSVGEEIPPYWGSEGEECPNIGVSGRKNASYIGGTGSRNISVVGSVRGGLSITLVAVKVLCNWQTFPQTHSTLHKILWKSFTAKRESNSILLPMAATFWSYIVVVHPSKKRLKTIGCSV